MWLLLGGSFDLQSFEQGFSMSLPFYLLGRTKNARRQIASNSESFLPDPGPDCSAAPGGKSLCDPIFFQSAIPFWDISSNMYQVMNV